MEEEKTTVLSEPVPQFTDFPDVVTIPDICAMLNIGESSARKLIKNGSLREIPCCKNIRVAKTAVIKYVQNNS